ncbi:uncharacterized protein PGTG_19104 [Puccinia graminis f. sp. tritici CRL 75-36-700-3]|uniref:Uncharacterized protein n=1 Tax=Puccinia graminis f. sp. tritici (strain CRL 75-36-700-3 / race SCCL) TaxID=418459 RepID=E3L9Y6_PUCGT|nr:uncharacterized protein PGTG_19094 [Puccinia graminis f. sp. tritici CRL 75-36-700-3]XP_003337790.2 uncharacterized protein PGTG_19104 [Puccinia graminis f. sp. tritici CRL 75-36-700-3]EFP93361.2 hypothetical protein PGTG_19094 [Puccinia graminis f. sp. tritici CRL 75-36-700-3]EFP93371.2 hypothetical protein PGTG_19104 [Puccinia graminis f. sp. tritici CRL 75-36-700-3]
MVRQAAKTPDVNLDWSVQDLQGFAHVFNHRPQHSHSKKPNNGIMPQVYGQIVPGIFVPSI